ncbi:MAG: hypothetical protein IJP78_04200 [Clostridia bacterium]|nr:hypothetical protein [Clostridia bacterium]
MTRKEFQELISDLTAEELAQVYGWLAALIHMRGERGKLNASCKASEKE